MSMLYARKQDDPRETHAGMRRICKLHIDRPISQSSTSSYQLVARIYIFVLEGDLHITVVKAILQSNFYFFMHFFQLLSGDQGIKLLPYMLIALTQHES